MKRVFSHPNSLLVFNFRNVLCNHQISCETRNDGLASTAGETPPTEVWAELWVIKELDYERAERLIQEAIHGDPKATSWFCQHCSEDNAPAFELCWKCGEERAI
jgi:Putative prokaryotic signal transducing protein